MKESWWKLFNFFDEAIDETRKIKVKEIKRQSKRLMVEDLVIHLRKAESKSNLGNFVFPWVYSPKVFLTDKQKVDNVWQTETAKDTEARLNDLEKRVELSHNTLIFELRSWSAHLIKMLPPPQASTVQQMLPPSTRPYSAVLNGQGIPPVNVPP